MAQLQVESKGASAQQKFGISRKLADPDSDVVIEEVLLEPKFGEAG